MKGFLEWFKAGTKMKRWLFVILMGVILACFGISEILVMKELNFMQVAKVILAFVVGFTLVIIGNVCMQKRTLEVIIESSDKRMKNKKEVNINSLIFNKKVFAEGPKIVVIGGGSGLNTVLEGMKQYTSQITAIATVSDYGKTPTNSRKQLDMLPMGDIKESMIALSDDQEAMQKLMDLEFSRGKLQGLSFSDIYFSAMGKISEDFTSSVSNSNKILNIVGKVLPVTLEEVKICAELEDGTVVEEKDKIAEVVYDKVTKINRIYISPSNCKAAPGVIEAIKEADAIVIGPGSLYTNVIPNLLVNGVAKAIKESKAIKIYISNIMTEPGQTDNYGVSDHINAITEHVGQGIIDFCIYDTGEIIPEFIKKYNLEGADLVEQDIAKVKGKGIHFLQRNLSCVNGDFIRHNPVAVAAAIIEIICDDLKFKDKQSDPQYLMLNAKLKYEKKINKLPKTKKEKKPSKHEIDKTDMRRQSKFTQMYGERIKSIQNTDKTIAENRRKMEQTKEED